MIKKYFLILIMVIFFIGCVTMEDKYRYGREGKYGYTLEQFINDYPDSPYTEEAKRILAQFKEYNTFKDAETNNSVAAFRDFLEIYPNGPFSDEAKERINEPIDEAFNRTCKIGTIQAFRGFAESYSYSEYGQIARDYVDFLKSVESKSFESYKQFISQNPNSFFALEAKATFPILWLNELKKKVGIYICIIDFIKWKGILGGAGESEEKIRQNIFNEIKSEIEKEGVVCTLLDSISSIDPMETPIILVATYREQKGQSYRSSDSYNTSPYAADQLHKAATDNLAAVISDILFGPTVSIDSKITIMDADTGFEYYKNVYNLNSKVDKREIIRALGIFHSERIIPSLLIALKDKDWEVRWYAIKALEEIKEPRSVQLLISGLRDEDFRVRLAAVQTLKGENDPNSVESFIAALKDDNWSVRGEAALALGNLKDPRAISPLINALKDEYGYVRREACDALEKITLKSFDEDLNKWEQWWEQNEGASINVNNH